MSKFVILLAGNLTPTERLRRQVTGRRVLAADGGIRHAASLELHPEIWIGDFDSASGMDDMPWRGVPRIAFPGDKDMTDGELAVDAARERGATDLLLAGAFGGPRADHALALVMQVLQLADEGLGVMMSDGKQEGFPVLPGEHQFDFPRGTLFSLVGFTDLTGLSVSGAKWPLSGRKTRFGSSLTLSNEVTGKLEIVTETGKALLIASLPG